MVDHPSELPVPLADVETAQRIADAARAGRPVDRSPTIEQLLAAFGQDTSTGPGTRVRVEQALKLAGVGVSPPLVDVPEGTRVFLTPGRGPGGGKGRRAKRLLLGLLLLALVIGGVTAAALTLSDDGGGRASSLPAGTTTAGTTAPVSTATTGQGTATGTTASTAGTPSTASTASTPSTAATTTSTADAAAQATAAAEKAAAEKEAAAARKDRAAEKRRRAKAAADRRAAEARRMVVVSVQPREPTYLCAKNGAGRVLFAGTLSRKRVFRSATVRLNIGTSSAVVRVRGNVFRLSGSPSGLLAQAGGKQPVALPSGQRPSC